MAFLDRLRFRVKDQTGDANWRELERWTSKLLGPWQDYEPSWTASTTNPTIGNGTIAGEWREFGDLVFVRVSVLAGSTTTFGSGFYSITIPFQSDNLRRQVVSGEIYSSTAARRWTLAGDIPAGSTTINRINYDGGSLTGTAPVTLASGDEFVLQGLYRPA